MYLWSIDAREAIKDVDDIDDDLIQKTDDIEVFLNQNRYYFVIATKGLGKSLLLLSKRRQLQLKGIQCIPRDLLLDVPEITIEALSQDTHSLLLKEQTMSIIWSMSTIIAIIKHLKMTDEILKEDISKPLRDLLNREKCMTVSAHLAEILTSITRREFFQNLTEDYNRTLIPAAQTVNKSVAVFIDNVDECFEQSSRDIWYTAQNSLIKAIYKLVRLNPRFKLFASIRKEAFLKLREETEMFSQYKGVSLDLLYYKEELREIFIKNIKREDTKKLADKNSLDENPMRAFLGIDKVHHGYVDEEEDIFDYIYRHTLKRPRDLMEIGGAISGCPIAVRNHTEPHGIDRIKSLINETATSIASTYIKEVLPNLTITDQHLDKVLGLIDSNILEKNKLKEICMKFNGNDAGCMDKDCKTCTDKIHIFCELYKIGLLGYVSEDSTKKGKCSQKFTTVGEKTFDEVRLLPDSAHYLVHPILDELIRRKNDRYKDQINTMDIVGYDRPWKIVQDVSPESICRPTVFISSTKDLNSYRDEIEEIIKKKNFAPVRSETLNRPNALEVCKESAKNCHYFVAILGQRYGEEKNGMSICEHEFNAAYEANPDKIIVYVLEGDIKKWDKKQEIFVQRVQGINRLGFLRGDRINPSNIKNRFEKDLVERIAILSKRKKG